MGKLVAAYESYLMNIRHASDNTVASYLRDVRQFTTYLEQTDGPALERARRRRSVPMCAI